LLTLIGDFLVADVFALEPVLAFEALERLSQRLHRIAFGSFANQFEGELLFHVAMPRKSDASSIDRR
jgi:hypothetical protein